MCFIRIYYFVDRVYWKINHKWRILIKHTFLPIFNNKNKSFLKMKIIVTNILINCITVLLHIFSMITSICCFILIVYRWNFNLHHLRRTSITSISYFDDPIELLLIGNTYLIFIVFSATWLSILIHTVAGDFSVFENFLYLGDSTACRVRIAMIFFLTSAFFHSFLLQALRCFFKVKILNSDSFLVFTQKIKHEKITLIKYSL